MTRTLTVKIPRPLAARLSARVRKRQTTQSAVVREALERYLQEGSDASDSFLNLARDLVGSLSGPIDLSSNRRHLRGFGR